MSLHWNVGKVKDNETVCFEVAERSNGYDRIEGETYLKPFTDALIWLTMSVGLDEIAEDNIDEWLYRIAIDYAIHDATTSRCVNGEWVRMRHDENTIRQHIGLYTNAGTISRKEYHEKVLRILASKGKDILEEAKEYNETFEEKHELTDKGWVSR